MTEFNWQKYENWISRKEWNTEGHKEECNCPTCHAFHVDEHVFVENAVFHKDDFRCCIDELRDKIEKRLICYKHPFSYSEVCVDGNGKKIGTYCEQCDQENSITPV